MKQKLSNIKNKLVALWWFLTRKNYYLLSYNGRKSKFLESGNVVIPEFIEWVRKKHSVPTNHEIIMELKNIGNLCISTDILAYKFKKMWMIQTVSPFLALYQKGGSNVWK